MVMRGVILNLEADSCSLGTSKRISKNVLTTLTVMVFSSSSDILNVLVIIPAFGNKASRRGRAAARLAKLLTEKQLSISSSHTSTELSSRLVDCNSSCLAASPLFRSRTAMINFSTPRRNRWRLASRPSPWFEPVTMIVCPLRSPSGYGSSMKVLENRVDETPSRDESKGMILSCLIEFEEI